MEISWEEVVTFEASYQSVFKKVVLSGTSNTPTPTPTTQARVQHTTRKGEKEDPKYGGGEEEGGD